MLAYTNERVNKNSKKGLLLMQQPFFYSPSFKLGSAFRSRLAKSWFRYW